MNLSCSKRSSGSNRSKGFSDGDWNDWNDWNNWNEKIG